MKRLFSLWALFLLVQISLGRTIIVDKYGGGQYTAIQTALSAATDNDTVKVWPGQYSEQISLSRNITLMGSGYENTIITGGFNPAVNMSAGKMMWFMISSTTGDGVNLSGGTLENVLVIGCARYGIVTTTGTASVLNCLILNSGSDGVRCTSSSANMSVTNCISRSNTGFGFNGSCGINCNSMNLSYSNGSRSATLGNQGCIDQDPLFVNAAILDFHISQSSPCWNTGNPSYSDPDGSRSDMGYFGGPDCPIYPVVTEILITPGGTTVNLQAKGRANY